jgi:hypothetical protein
MGKKTPEKADENLSEFKVGDRVKVNLHTGRIVDATVKAVANSLNYSRTARLRRRRRSEPNCLKFRAAT